MPIEYPIYIIWHWNWRVVLVVVMMMMMMMMIVTCTAHTNSSQRGTRSGELSNKARENCALLDVATSEKGNSCSGHLQSSCSALSLASGPQGIQISDMLGSPRLLSNGFFVEFFVGGHVAIKTPSAIFDPVNKVFRIEGVWSIPGGREITPEHQIFTLGLDVIEKESGVWRQPPHRQLPFPPHIPPKPCRQVRSP